MEKRYRVCAGGVVRSVYSVLANKCFVCVCGSGPFSSGW